MSIPTISGDYNASYNAPWTVMPKASIALAFIGGLGLFYCGLRERNRNFICLGACTMTLAIFDHCITRPYEVSQGI
jgi:hypothetical protein